jgi:hypothetical protein
LSFFTNSLAGCDKKGSATLEKNDEKHVLIPGEIEPGTSFEKPSVNVQIQQ